MLECISDSEFRACVGCRSMRKKAGAVEKPKKKTKKKRREGRKPRLAKSWKPRKAGAGSPIPGLQKWSKSGRHVKKEEKELLGVVYNNIQVMRKRKQRGADSADEFTCMTGVSYKTLYNWTHPPKKKAKKNEDTGPDGLVEAAEEDDDCGGFSDDDLFGDAPLTHGGRSMGHPFKRGRKPKDPRGDLALSRASACDRFSLHSSCLACSKERKIYPSTRKRSHTASYLTSCANVRGFTTGYSRDSIPRR